MEGSREMEEAIIRRTVVKPHWLTGGNTFWYRHELSDKKTEYIFVDTEKKTRQPAFDHKGLADILESETGTRPDPDRLSFQRSELAPDASWVRFQLDDKTWQYGPEGHLKPLEDGLARAAGFMFEESPSPRSVQEVSVTFTNHTNGSLDLFWINCAGEAVLYRKLGVGESKTRHTYVGHVWRLNDRKTGIVKMVFTAPADEAECVVEDEPMGGALGPAGFTPDSEDEPNDRLGSEGPGFFVRDFNFWVKEEDGTEHQLSTNGTEANPYDQDRLYPSQGARFIVAWQYTPEEEHTINLVESSPADRLEPRLQSYRYLKPGDKVRVDRPRLFDVAGRREVPTDAALFENPYKLRDIGWTDDGKEYFFLFNERGHQHVRILAIDTQGAVRAIVDESSESFVDYSTKLYKHFSRDLSELLWASERDGWNHLYLYDVATGTVKNQVTRGEWNVHVVHHVDEAKRTIWFGGFGMVAGEDPYHGHLARVGFDGSDFRVLTTGDGMHSWKWSPDRRHVVDRWSRVDLPPTTVVLDAASGEVVVTLEENDVDELLAAGWEPPERFAAPGRDGKTLMYGIIVRPRKLDATKTYGVLENIYAGPQSFATPKSFGRLNDLRWWADVGPFVVVQLDGMGTNWRSKAFHDVCHKNLRDAGFPDRIAWIRAAAADGRPWMDIDRVGVRGVSAGGQNAVAALIWHHDFYSAAVADSGCHDNRMDKIWWNEQWMGWPVDDSYVASSNVVHAADLQGDLMLIVGDMDNNVDPSCTLQLVKALNDAEIEYDLMFMPGGGHGCGVSNWARKRSIRFLRWSLLGELDPSSDSSTAEASEEESGDSSEEEDSSGEKDKRDDSTRETAEGSLLPEDASKEEEPGDESSEEDSSGGKDKRDEPTRQAAEGSLLAEDVSGEQLKSVEI